MAKKDVTCCKCKKVFTEYDLGRIEYNSKHFCVDCLREYLASKGMDEQKANDLIRSLLKKREEKVSASMMRDSFYMWIQNEYDLEIIPTRVFTVIGDIENGTYKKMRYKIPLKDLYEMWLDQEPYMKDYDARKGITGSGRLFYDIAVLVSTFPEYNRKKEEKNIERKVSNEPKNIYVKIDKTKLNFNDSQEDEASVEDMLKEIEGE